MNREFLKAIGLKAIAVCYFVTFFAFMTYLFRFIGIPLWIAVPMGLFFVAMEDTKIGSSALMATILKSPLPSHKRRRSGTEWEPIDRVK